MAQGEKQSKLWLKLDKKPVKNNCLNTQAKVDT